jgi:hypothetical protein
MFRTHSTFSLLQAVAVVATLATIMWSVGGSAFRFAEAANVISFSDTLSDSAPTVVANHTITFVTPSGLAAGETVSLEFATTGFSGIDSLDAQDLDLNVNGVEQSLIDGAASGADWQVVPAGTTIDLISGTSTIGTNATVTIRIGTNATSGGAGANQITNPSVGSYEITVAVGNSDTGAMRVAIVDAVTVTATVETVFDFTVLGVDAGLDANGDTTTATSTSTAIPFGVLVADTMATAAQDLQVDTNASNGFVVTVQTDQQLTSANGADIDGFADGTFTTTPVIWAGPSATLGTESTYGHWGITTNDPTVTPGLTDEFNASSTGQYYVSASTTPVEVFRHDGPTNGTTQGVGLTRVGYSVEVSALQEAGNDYTATLTYVATPVF